MYSLCSESHGFSSGARAVGLIRYCGWLVGFSLLMAISSSLCFAQQIEVRYRAPVYLTGFFCYDPRNGAELTCSQFDSPGAAYAQVVGELAVLSPWLESANFRPYIESPFYLEVNGTPVLWSHDKYDISVSPKQFLSTDPVVQGNSICPPELDRLGTRSGVQETDWCRRKIDLQPPSSCQSPRVSNPVAIITGEKEQPETDYSSPGGLTVSRMYRGFSGWQHSVSARTVFDNTRSDQPSQRCYPGSYELAVNLGTTDTVTRHVCLLQIGNGLNEYHLYDKTGQVSRFTGTPESPVGDPGFSTALKRVTNANGQLQWLATRPDGTIEVYDLDGKLLAEWAVNGRAVSYAYSDATTPPAVAPRAGLPIGMQDAFGRRIAFSYDSAGRPAGFASPDGKVYSYEYDGPTSGCSTPGTCGLLSGILYPDNVHRRYHYNEPALINGGVACSGNPKGFPLLLTGITDENGARFGKYSYDCQRRTVGSEHAGQADKFGFSYLNAYETDVTDPSGSAFQYRFTDAANVKRLFSTNQPAGSGCGPSSSALAYDANGNVSSRDDFKGHRSCYKNDLTRNLETARVEGLSSASACPADAASYAIPANLPASSPQIKVSTAWHPDWRLEVKRAEPKKLTTWIYNGQPDPSAGNAIASCAPSGALLPDGKPIAVLCKKIEQATSDASGTLSFAATVTGSARTWRYTYNAYGQILSEDGPRTDIADTTTYTYYSDTVFDANGAGHTLGDLWKVTNAKGQVTETTLYDKHGHPLEIKDPNGMITRLTWHVRGWLSGKSVGPATGTRQSTTYDYDAVGQLKKVTNPDGSYLAYTYDDAHRLTDLSDGLGNAIHYTLDAMGNRTKEEVKDPAGTLVKTQRRVYDALNRVQNLITPN